MVDDTCRSILELAILEDLLVKVQINRLATRVHKAREEMTKVQLELNLQIIELRLEVQPSTPPKVRE